MISENGREEAKRQKINEILYAGSRAVLEEVLGEFADFPLEVEIEDKRGAQKFAFQIPTGSERFFVRFFFPYGLFVQINFPVSVEKPLLVPFRELLNELREKCPKDENVAKIFTEAKKAFDSWREKSRIQYEIGRSGVFSPPLGEDSKISLPVEYVEALFKKIYGENGFQVKYSVLARNAMKIIQSGGYSSPGVIVVQFDLGDFFGFSAADSPLKISQIYNSFPNPFFGAYEEKISEFLSRLTELRDSLRLSERSAAKLLPRIKAFWPEGFLIENKQIFFDEQPSK